MCSSDLFFRKALSIFAPIQANEAARLHHGLYDEFEASITERLKWGASLSETEVKVRKEEQIAFRSSMNDLFNRFDFILWPCAPLSRLIAGKDQRDERSRILSYTVPVSLAGLPAVALPGGMQLVGKYRDDARLLAFSSTLPALTTYAS